MTTVIQFMLIVAESLTGQCAVQVVRGHKEKDIVVILLKFFQSLLQGNLNMAYCEWKRLFTYSLRLLT